ncbi:UvrD-helicase domain-containing protein [Microtetraspora sp. AC03309]|uniref:UvrD-helicase domain-containing protein n=1 Tax=Microtetraspora sp. AC03309 TaxID=2779376 RepID=UPI0027DEF316|nr:UvrD-helicase domain-containing protein [Microtetraspora sp. AC03309]
MELPAGGGKTWLLVDTIRQVANQAGKALVLTHTNAGVHSIQNKMRDLGVDPKAAHVGTITSLAFELVRSYSRIAGLEVPEIPDWDNSVQYVEGAQRVLRNRHVRDVLTISYSHLLIDEYQDCSLAQHALVLELAQAIPACAVFGDRLQGIFGFRDTLVDWQTDVLAHFPPFTVKYVPHRWVEHNQPLGIWLHQIRDLLQPGSQVAFNADLPTGVTFVPATQQKFELREAALRSRPEGETVVIIAPPDKGSARLAAGRLNGAYTTMEDIGGTFMMERLAELEGSQPGQFALWLAHVAKKCFSGYSKVDQTVLNRLQKGKTVSGLSRPGLERTLAALDNVLSNPTFETLSTSMRAIGAAKEARLHSREAWNDMATALGHCGPGTERSPKDELGRVRDRLRHGGRRPSGRVVSRTALIKGLEYDHVIISDLDRLTDHCNLYVALTRARKTVTIIGRTATITVSETKRGPTVSAVSAVDK